MKFFRVIRQTFQWVVRFGSLGLRLKLFALALIGVTAIPPIYYALHVRRCQKEEHNHDPHWYSGFISR